MNVRTNGSLLIHWWITAVLVLLLLGSGAFADSKMRMSGNITAKIGEAVTMSCKVPEGETVTQVEWRFGGCNGRKILVYNTENPVAFEKDYISRVSDVTSNGYTLLKAQKKDAGTYCCSLSTFPSGTQKGLLYLNFRKDKPGSETPLVIIVYIVCGILAVLMLGGLITGLLLCKSCRTSVQDPVHVAVHSGRHPHHPPSILQKSQTHHAPPSKSSSEVEEVEEDDNMDYLNVTPLRLPRIPSTASSALRS